MYSIKLILSIVLQILPIYYYTTNTLLVTIHPISSQDTDIPREINKEIFKSESTDT